MRFYLLLLLAGCSVAEAAPPPAEYRTVPCSTYGLTAVVYTGVDRRVLERSVLAVQHDTSTNPEVTTVLLPSFVASGNGVAARVSCYGNVDFVREL